MEKTQAAARISKASRGLGFTFHSISADIEKCEKQQQ